MSVENILTGIHGEISRREVELEDWREFARLAEKLLGPGATGPAAELPPAPQDRAPQARRARAGAPSARAPRGAGRAPSRRPQHERAILSLLSTRGPLGAGAIVEALGENANTIKHVLYGLAGEGKLVATGNTSKRTYDVARNGDKPGQPEPSAGGTNEDAPALSPRVAKLEAQAREPAADPVELEDQVLAVLRDVGGRVAVSEIEFQLRRRHGECDRGQLEKAIKRLSTHGLAVRDPGGGLRLSEQAVERPLLDVIADVAGVDAL